MHGWHPPVLGAAASLSETAATPPTATGTVPVGHMSLCPLRPLRLLPGSEVPHPPGTASLFLQGLMGKHKAHGRLETASKLEQPQIHAGPVPAPTVPAQSPDPARARSGPALGKYVTGSSQGPEKGQASAEGRSASAEQATPDPGPDPEPAQPRLARICPPDGSAHQGSAAGTESANPGAGETAGRLSIAVLEQKPQEETLLQQHWAALLRLRKTAREEKARAERALQEHQLGCLEHRGHGTTGAALGERAPQALSRLEEERVQREMPGLQDMHWPVLQGGQQLPQQQEATLTAQRTPTPRLQSPGPQVKAAGEGASEAGQQLEGALCPPKPHRSCSPVSPRVQRGSKSAEVTHLACDQWEETTKTTEDATSHQQPPRPASGEDIAGPSSPLEEEGSHIDQEPCKPWPGYLHSDSLNSGQLLDSACPALEAEQDTPAAQLGVQEVLELLTGDTQTQARDCWARKRPPAPQDGCAHGFQGHGLQCLGADRPCCLQEASDGGISEGQQQPSGRFPSSSCDPGGEGSTPHPAQACYVRAPGL
nr:uncharacterized protein LOC106028360 isoform X3 [Cavia porcellus]